MYYPLLKHPGSGQTHAFSYPCTPLAILATCSAIHTIPQQYHTLDLHRHDLPSFDVASGTLRRRFVFRPHGFVESSWQICISRAWLSRNKKLEHRVFRVSFGVDSTMRGGRNLSLLQAWRSGEVERQPEFRGSGTSYAHGSDTGTVWRHGSG